MKFSQKRCEEEEKKINKRSERNAKFKHKNDERLRKFKWRLSIAAPMSCSLDWQFFERCPRVELGVLIQNENHFLSFLFIVDSIDIVRKRKVGGEEFSFCDGISQLNEQRKIRKIFSLSAVFHTLSTLPWLASREIHFSAFKRAQSADDEGENSMKKIFLLCGRKIMWKVKYTHGREIFVYARVVCKVENEKEGKLSLLLGGFHFHTHIALHSDERKREKSVFPPNENFFSSSEFSVCESVVELWMGFERRWEIFNSVFNSFARSPWPWWVGLYTALIKIVFLSSDLCLM